MALIVFPHDKLGPELEPLLHPNLRREVADSVNLTLLSRPPSMKMLIRAKAWAEKNAKASNKGDPSQMGVDLSLDLTGSSSQTTANGSEAMNTSF